MPWCRATPSKLRAIEDAQRDGRLPTAFSAAELLGIVIHTAALWSGATPEYARLTDEVWAARRRQVVVATVAAVVRG